MNCNFEQQLPHSTSLSSITISSNDSLTLLTLRSLILSRHVNVILSTNHLLLRVVVFILSTYHLLLLRAIPFSLNQKHCNLLPKSLTASPRRNATLLVASHSIAACANSHVRLIGLPSRSSFYVDFSRMVDCYIALGM